MTMVNLNLFKKKDRSTTPKGSSKASTKVEAAKPVTPPSSPRGRQKEREEDTSSSPVSLHQRSHAPVRTMTKSMVKSDRDLYNDLLEEATGTQHTCSTSNSSLEFDGNNSSRFSVELELPDIVSASSPSKSPKKVIVDSQQQSRPKSPGHTGHERRQKFTFVGEILDDEDEDGTEFGEEEAVDFIKNASRAPVQHAPKPKAVRPEASSKRPTSKSKKKVNAARCDAV